MLPWEWVSEAHPPLLLESMQLGGYGQVRLEGWAWALAQIPTTSLSCYRHHLLAYQGPLASVHVEMSATEWGERPGLSSGLACLLLAQPPLLPSLYTLISMGLRMMREGGGCMGAEIRPEFRPSLTLPHTTAQKKGLGLDRSQYVYQAHISWSETGSKCLMSPDPTSGLGLVESVPILSLQIVYFILFLC